MMTKQEEIQKEVEGHIRACLAFKEMDCSIADSLSDSLMLLLDGLGVVIKVDRELPICFGAFRSPKNQRENDYLLGWNDNKDNMLSGGYVAVEPLIGGDNAVT